jgi:hypothetical protein
MPAAKAIIAAWGLPRNLLLGVYQTLLNDVAADPDKFLGERIAPHNAFRCPFVLDNPGGFPLKVWFVFAVARDEAKKELHVLGGRMSTMDEGLN